MTCRLAKRAAKVEPSQVHVRLPYLTPAYLPQDG